MPDSAKAAARYSSPAAESAANDKTPKEEYKHELERVKEEYRKLEKRKTFWMVSAIILLALFVITLALKLTH